MEKTRAIERATGKWVTLDRVYHAASEDDPFGDYYEYSLKGEKVDISAYIVMESLAQEPDWEERRFRLVKAMLQGVYSNPGAVKSVNMYDLLEVADTIIYGLRNG